MTLPDGSTENQHGDVIVLVMSINALLTNAIEKIWEAVLLTHTLWDTLKFTYKLWQSFVIPTPDASFI